MAHVRKGNFLHTAYGYARFSWLLDTHDMGHYTSGYHVMKYSLQKTLKKSILYMSYGYQVEVLVISDHRIAGQSEPWESIGFWSSFSLEILISIKYSIHEKLYFHMQTRF